MKLVTSNGSCEVYPQSVQHNPNGRFVVVCGDGEYIIYTAMALRNESFGSAQESVSGLAFFDWETQELVSRIEIQPKNVYWSETCELCCTATKESYFVLKYDPEKVAADMGVMAIEHANFDGIEWLALVTGGEIVSTFGKPGLVKISRLAHYDKILFYLSYSYFLFHF